MMASATCKKAKYRRAKLSQKVGLSRRCLRLYQSDYPFDHGLRSWAKGKVPS